MRGSDRQPCALSLLRGARSGPRRYRAQLVAHSSAGRVWLHGILNVTPRLLWIQNSNKEPPTVTNPTLVAEVHFPRSAQRYVRWPGWERVTGIEPAFSAWEADVLPLNYTRVDGA